MTDRKRSWIVGSLAIATGFLIALAAIMALGQRGGETSVSPIAGDITVKYPGSVTVEVSERSGVRVSYPEAIPINATTLKKINATAVRTILVDLKLTDHNGKAVFNLPFGNYTISTELRGLRANALASLNQSSTRVKVKFTFGDLLPIRPMIHVHYREFDGFLGGSDSIELVYDGPPNPPPKLVEIRATSPRVPKLLMNVSEYNTSSFRQHVVLKPLTQSVDASTIFRSSSIQVVVRWLTEELELGN